MIRIFARNSQLTWPRAVAFGRYSTCQTRNSYVRVELLELCEYKPTELDKAFYLTNIRLARLLLLSSLPNTVVRESDE